MFLFFSQQDILVYGTNTIDPPSCMINSASESTTSFKICALKSQSIPTGDDVIRCTFECSSSITYIFVTFGEHIDNASVCEIRVLDLHTS